MTEWLRLWHDMPTDPKWRAIARKSGKPLPCVIALFNLLLVNASANAAKRGTLSNWSDEDAAAALDMDEADVVAIIAAMEGKVITDGRLTGWERRQPKREDGTAAERKAAWKERQNALERIGTHGNAPETETETEKKEDTQSQASPSTVTRARARGDGSDDAPEQGPAPRKPNRTGEPEGFQKFYSLFPNKVGRPKAASAYAAAIKRGATAGEIESGLRRYISNKPPDRQWLNPATFLNQDRFRDEPAAIGPFISAKHDKRQELWNAFDRVERHFNIGREGPIVMEPFKLTTN